VFCITQPLATRSKKENGEKSRGLSPFCIRWALQSIQNKNLTIFEKIDIFVTGHIFKKSKLLAEPFLISPEDLLFYLERYPISLTDSKDYIT
jgi:hypothetical protein